MLVYFGPAAMCHVREAGLVIAPLPAQKQLWEAADELMWKAELGREEVGVAKDFALAGNGDAMASCTVSVMRCRCASPRMPLLRPEAVPTESNGVPGWMAWVVLSCLPCP